MIEYFNELVQGGISGFVTKLLEDLIQTFSQIVVYILKTAQDVLNEPMIVNGTKYFQALALTYVSIKIIIEAISTYILHTNGDPDADPGGLLSRSIQSVAVILSIPWLTRWVYLLGTTIADDVSKLTGVNKTDLGMLTLEQTISSIPISVGLIMIVGVVFIILIFIQTFARGAEFGLLSMTGSIAALNLISTDRSLFKLWWRQLLVVGLSQGLQILLLKASFYSLINVKETVPVYSILKFIGWIWVTYKMPSWIKQCAYSSGLGGGVGGTAQTVTSSMIMKKVIAKGVVK